jgi:hypothetical protein
MSKILLIDRYFCAIGIHTFLARRRFVDPYPGLLLISELKAIMMFFRKKIGVHGYIGVKSNSETLL